MMLAMAAKTQMKAECASRSLLKRLRIWANRGVHTKGAGKPLMAATTGGSMRWRGAWVVEETACKIWWIAL